MSKNYLKHLNIVGINLRMIDLEKVFRLNKKNKLTKKPCKKTFDINFKNDINIYKY